MRGKVDVSSEDGQLMGNVTMKNIYILSVFSLEK